MAPTADTWVIRRDVPVYDAHVLVDRHTGRELARIDQARLQRIAERSNARARTTGDLCPLTVGHTRDGAPEPEQPPIVGYASDFYVAARPGDGRATLYAREWRLHPESAVGGETLSADEVLRRWPRRSAEVWLTDDVIDPIALLGASTPQRDLGLIRCAKRGPRVRYQLGACMDLQTFLAALQNLIAQASASAGPDAGAAMPDDQQPVQYAAAAPTSTNVAVPGDDLERVRMQRDQQAIRLATLETDSKRRDAELADLRLKYQRSTREKDLIQLEAEGYQFDRGEELDGLAPLADADYAKQLGRIRARYQRVPSGSLIATAPVREGGAKARATKDDANKAVRLSQSRKIPYEQALNEVLTGAA